MSLVKESFNWDKDKHMSDLSYIVSKNSLVIVFLFLVLQKQTIIITLCNYILRWCESDRQTKYLMRNEWLDKMIDTEISFDIWHTFCFYFLIWKNDNWMKEAHFYSWYWNEFYIDQFIQEILYFKYFPYCKFIAYLLIK